MVVELFAGAIIAATPACDFGDYSVVVPDASDRIVAKVKTIDSRTVDCTYINSEVELSVIRYAHVKATNSNDAAKVFKALKKNELNPEYRNPALGGGNGST